MPKRTGITSRRRPSFDSLESRSLLGAGYILTSRAHRTDHRLTDPHGSGEASFPNALALTASFIPGGFGGPDQWGARLSSKAFHSSPRRARRRRLRKSCDRARLRVQANLRSQAVPTVAIPSGSAPLTGSFPTALTTSRFAATEAQLSGVPSLRLRAMAISTT